MPFLASHALRRSLPIVPYRKIYAMAWAEVEGVLSREAAPGSNFFFPLSANRPKWLQAILAVDETKLCAFGIPQFTSILN